MAYDVRIPSSGSNITPHFYPEKNEFTAPNEKLVFISIKAKGFVTGEDLQNSFLDELVRLHGNSVLCNNSNSDATETHVESLNLPFSDSSIRKIATGDKYIGILFNDGRVCRVRHSSKQQHLGEENRGVTASNGTSARNKDVGNGTSLQIASDEIFARTLQDNIDRQNRGSSRSVFPNLVFPSTSHDPRLSRVSRRYEPYSLNNRGRRVSLLPNLFEIDERTGTEQPYRSNNTSLVLGPRPGQVLQFQRISGNGDLPYDNLPRHIPVIVGQTVRLPERIYSEPIRVSHPSLEDALNARRSQSSLLGAVTDYDSTEVSEFSFSLGGDPNSLTRFPPGSRNFDEGSSGSRTPIRSQLGESANPRLSVESGISLASESPGLIQFVENYNLGPLLSPTVLNSEGETSNDPLGTATLSSHPVNYSTGQSAFGEDPDAAIPSLRQGSPSSESFDNSYSTTRLEDKASSNGVKTEECVEKTGHGLPGYHSEAFTSIKNDSIVENKEIQKDNNIDDGENEVAASSSQVMAEVVTPRPQGSQFDMDSILSSGNKTPKHTVPGKSQLKLLMSRFNVPDSEGIDFSNSLKQNRVTVDAKTEGKPKSQFSPALSDSMQSTSTMQEPPSTSVIEYPPGFRPMTGRLGFMNTKEVSALPDFSGKKISGSDLASGSENLQEWWPDVGQIEWLDDGIRYGDIAALQSEFLLVTEKDKILKSWPTFGDSKVVDNLGSLKADYHLLNEGIKIVSSSVIRATIVTESGKFATLYDRSVRESFNGGIPALIKQLSHPCQTFGVLENEEVVDVKCSFFATVIMTRSGKVFWWGLPPSTERHLLDKKNQVTVQSDQEIKIGDTVGLKRQNNEVGSLVLKLSEPLYPKLGIIRNVCGDTAVEGSDGTRRYIIDVVEDVAQTESNNHSLEDLQRKDSAGKVDISTEDSEIQLINFKSACSVLRSAPVSLESEDNPMLTTSVGGQDKPEGAGSTSVGEVEQTSKEVTGHMWASNDVLFLEESTSVLGKVVAIDGQFAVVSPLDMPDSAKADQPPKLFSNAYKVFFLSTVEKINSDLFAGASSSTCSKSRYNNIIEKSPRLIQGVPFTSSEANKYQALCMDVNENGVSLLIKRLSDDKVFLLHPKSVKEDNSKVFTCSKSNAVTIESLVSEANVTQDFESVKAETANLNWLCKVTGAGNLHGKRKADESSAPSTVTSDRSRYGTCHEEMKPRLKVLSRPFTPFLFDNRGCPYAVKFLTCLRDPPALECGPFAEFEIIEYPTREKYNESVVTVVAAVKPLQLIPCAIRGNQEEFASKIKAIEKEVKRQKSTTKLLKRPRLNLPDSGGPSTSSSEETGRPVLMVDEVESRDSVSGNKATTDWLEERCSGNQNLLHICAANITLRSPEASEKHYFDMFHDEVFMLNVLLESSVLWPWVAKLLMQQDANGCTPFMTALTAKNHHAAYYILKAVRKHVLTSSGKSYLRSVLCTPSFSGITPIHQLIINASRRHMTPTFNCALRVTNIPTSYTPRMLLKLFKSRYASAYRACIPSIKSKWKFLTVRDKVKVMQNAKGNQEEEGKSNTDSLSMPSNPHAANPVVGGYLVGNRIPFGGERLQRANAIRASAKEGMIQFSNVDEMYQALSEMHGYGVLSETDHPSGVLTSVVQHVLNVQLFDEMTHDNPSRGCGHVRRFQPISRSETGYPPQYTSVTQVSRNPTPQTTPGRPLAPNVASGSSQDSNPLGKRRGENIAKCFDDIVGYMVLARLLLVFPEAGAITSDTKETALHSFFKNINRYHPSPLCKHFLLWRPCLSKKCCYQKFSNGLNITPAISSKTKHRQKQGACNSTKLGSTEDVRATDNSKATAAGTSGLSSSISNQSASEINTNHPLFTRSLSSQSTDLNHCSLMSEYAVLSGYCAEVVGEMKERAKHMGKRDSTESLELDDAETPTSVYSEPSFRGEDGDQPSKARENKMEYLDPVKDTFMAPSPSIMSCKVLENVDLDQLDDRNDTLSNFGDQPENTIAPGESDLGSTLRTSFSPQVPPMVADAYRPYPRGEASTLTSADGQNIECTMFVETLTGPRFDDAPVGGVQRSVYEERGSPFPSCTRGEVVFQASTEFASPCGNESELGSDKPSPRITRSNSTSSEPKDADTDCVCQETRQKLPLFDRFQAPVFQLAKNWPCIVASVLGFYNSRDIRSPSPLGQGAKNEIDVDSIDTKGVNEVVAPQNFLPSAKLDVFTEALMSSPFDILLEIVVKTIQSKLEGSPSIQMFDTIRECLETKLSSPPMDLRINGNASLYVAQRFVRSVVRHMSLFLGKHSPMEISLRYKIRKRGKASSKKEERMLLGLNVCLKAFSWLSVIELIRAATATIQPVCTGTVKAQPKAIVSGLMGTASGQMQQNVLFRPNIRIHGPQSQSTTTSSVIGRMAMRVNPNEAESNALRETQFTNDASQHASSNRNLSKVDRHGFSLRQDSDSDSDEDSLKPMEFRSIPVHRTSNTRTHIPEPMEIVEDDDEPLAPNWSAGVRIRPESPSAWALNGHVTSASELSIRVVNRLFGSQPQESKTSVVSLHHGNCYLARIFCRLVKEAVDLVKDLTEIKESKPAERTKPFDVQPLKFPEEVERQMKEYAMSLLDSTWKWMGNVLNNLERQLHLGQEYDTGHFVTRLQVPENELEYKGFGRPTQSYTYISQPEEYLLYLIKAQMGEERGSLPVLDLLSYSHLTFVLDAFIYSKKYWPKEKEGLRKSEKKRHPSGGQPHCGLFSSAIDLRLSEENTKFLGEYLSRSVNEELTKNIHSIVTLAKSPNIWLRMPNSNGQELQKDIPKQCLSSGILGQQESKDKRNESEEVREIHSKWKLTISSFCKLFLTEPPGYERESFLALEAGAAGRISRFQRSIAALRTAFKSDSSNYIPVASHDAVGLNPLLSVNVKRSELMEDCLKVFLDQMDNHPFGSLKVRFEGEEGAGPGVNRGLFASFANCLKSGQKILNWPVGLLHRPGVLPEQNHIYSPISGRRFCIEGDEPFQGKMTPFRRRMVFIAIGRFLGLTLWFNQAIPLIFSRGVLKFLLYRDEEIAFEDLAFHNASIFNALGQMLIDARNVDMTAKKFEDIYCLRFEAVVDDVVEELIPGGSEIVVVPDNVVDYIRLYTKHVLVTGIENELEGMREGLHQMIPRELLDSLTPEDLQLLLSGGVENVDFNRLKAIITFSNSRRCQKELFEKYKGWFWRIIRKMTPFQRQQLLHFATGSSVLPALDNKVGNNEELAITVDVIDGNTSALPMASTCGQRISLPLYPTKKILRKKILQAIECQAYGLG